MKKKFLALALSLTMVLGLAACGGGSDNASSDGSSAGVRRFRLQYRSGSHGFRFFYPGSGLCL